MNTKNVRTEKGLIVNELSVAYGDNLVLRNLSLFIEPSELIVIVGASGCGKTTLLNAIAGLVNIRSGKIKLNEKDITNLPPVDRNVGMVFQDYALYSNRSVFENVEFPLKMRGIPKSQRKNQVEDILNKLKLDKLTSRDASQLSGGEKQRVALARALIKEPGIFLLDEPLSNVDNEQQEDLRLLIKSIKNLLEVPAVHVTHNQIEAWRIADKIGVMTDGRIIQVGSPEYLFNNPMNIHIAKLVGDLEFNMIDIKDINPESARNILSTWPATRILGFRANEVIINEELGLDEENSNGIFFDTLIKESERYGSKYRHVAKLGENEIKIYIGNARELSIGTKIPVFIPLDKTYLFSNDGELLKGRE